MQKAEPQQGAAQNQSAARQGGGVALAAPQGEKIAQLEALIESSPQGEKQGALAALINAGPVMTAQRRLLDGIASSPNMAAQRKFGEGIHHSPRMAAQRKKNNSFFGAVQRVEDEEPLQGKFVSKSPAQLEQQPVSKPNNTGLPDNLKSGIESLSGLSMDNVKVHYNSSQPAQLNALAYAQGTDIHIAPGQERHLPHEAWHVVQQAQGRVQPTMQMKDGVAINDDKGLEAEADVMGGALTGGVKAKSELPLRHPATVQRLVAAAGNPGTLIGNSLQKFNEVIAATNMLGIGPAGGVLVAIAVDNRSEPNPAETNVVAGNINIAIRKWYIDISSVGEIVGLIAHELGVHNLGDMMMSRRSLRRERHRNQAGAGFQVNVGARQVGVAGWNAPPGHNRDAQDRQRDHVNVVRDQGGVAGNASARTRAYVETMLSLGDNIAAAPAVIPAAIVAQDQKLRDLLQTFLFDYARILVTDEGGPWRTFSNAAIISEVMQWYQNVLVARHLAAHAWLGRPAVQVNIGGWGLRGWLLGKLAQYAGNRIVDGIGRGIGAIGRAIRNLF